ncbi:hypothetical protein K438DRAFT_1812733 [Mycena galopus ATCC 62051]|nr:hypothetical protein K438DRAFT_1812733 [Mycena galopus ATCC 62051]
MGPSMVLNVCVGPAAMWFAVHGGGLLNPDTFMCPYGRRSLGESCALLRPIVLPVSLGSTLVWAQHSSSSSQPWTGFLDGDRAQ